MYLMRRDASLPSPNPEGLREEVNRLLDTVLRRSMVDGATRTWAPPVEIYDMAEELVVVAELPGFQKDEITISFEGGNLTFSGERKAPEEAEGRNYHRNERWYGAFERTFQLPAAYDVEQIQAKLQHGILTVTLPKKEESKARQISVSVS